MSMHTQITTKVNTFVLIETCISPLESSLYYHGESNNCTAFQTTSHLFSKELITVYTDDIKSCKTRTELYTQDGSEQRSLIWLVEQTIEARPLQETNCLTTTN